MKLRNLISVNAKRMLALTYAILNLYLFYMSIVMVLFSDSPLGETFLLFMFAGILLPISFLLNGLLIIDDRLFGIRQIVLKLYTPLYGFLTKIKESSHRKVVILSDSILPKKERIFCFYRSNLIDIMAVFQLIAYNFILPFVVAPKFVSSLLSSPAFSSFSLIWFALGALANIFAVLTKSFRNKFAHNILLIISYDPGQSFQDREETVKAISFSVFRFVSYFLGTALGILFVNGAYQLLYIFGYSSEILNIIHASEYVYVLLFIFIIESFVKTLRRKNRIWSDFFVYGSIRKKRYTRKTSLSMYWFRVPITNIIMGYVFHLIAISFNLIFTTSLIFFALIFLMVFIIDNLQGRYLSLEKFSIMDSIIISMIASPFFLLHTFLASGLIFPVWDTPINSWVSLFAQYY
uniref:Uncharacterized protein n=1 Tax=Candidatus Kentrum sp. TC TaxID=2126339 RepID=A0A450YSP6_9GAMM|nr:MAG: hypothetical protein BECKTC1821E_GA0114239_103635 [Candidatus Kentron sp. TC]